MNYVMLTNSDGSDRITIRHEDGQVSTGEIPTDPANTDYQRYLAWLAEGNEPEVIDLSG